MNHELTIEKMVMDDSSSTMDMSDDSANNKNKNEISSATVNGTVVSVMTAHRMVTIDREAIIEWDREAATVDFIVEADVDMSLFFQDAYVMFTFEIREGNFIIVSAMAMPKARDDAKALDEATGKGE